MAGSDKIKTTTVNLYESDIKTLERRGIPISDTLRSLLRHILESDSSDILYCIRHGQYAEQIKDIDRRIQRLLKDKGRLDKEREWIDTTIDELEKQKDMLQFNIETAEADYRHNQTIEQVINIGLELDQLIYQLNFDESRIRESIPEKIQEMEILNPGWSLSDHIEARKGVFRSH
jgi:predicted RNase H-like nuclease (RuvC/YqgF family)